MACAFARDGGPGAVIREAAACESVPRSRRPGGGSRPHRGDDPVKRRLRDDLPRIFAAGRRFFESYPDVTGERLYAEVERLAAEAGWELGGWHAGHLVGEFPHEWIDGADVESYITPANTTSLRRTDKAGRRCHWILEIHLVDREREFGGFHEELITL